MPEDYSKEQLVERAAYREKIATLKYDRLPSILMGDVAAVLHETNQIVSEIMKKKLLNNNPYELKQTEFFENWTAKIDYHGTQLSHIHTTLDEFLIIIIQGLTNNSSLF